MTFIYFLQYFWDNLFKSFFEFCSFVYMISETKYLIQSHIAFQRTSAVLHVFSLYNSNISISNGSSNSFGKDDISLRKRLFSI